MEPCPHLRKSMKLSQRDQFLKKLRREYEHVRSNLKNWDPVPSLDISSNELLREEDRSRHKQTWSKRMDPILLMLDMQLEANQEAMENSSVIAVSMDILQTSARKKFAITVRKDTLSQV